MFTSHAILHGGSKTHNNSLWIKKVITGMLLIDFSSLQTADSSLSPLCKAGYYSLVNLMVLSGFM